MRRANEHNHGHQLPSAFSETFINNIGEARLEEVDDDDDCNSTDSDEPMMPENLTPGMRINSLLITPAAGYLQELICIANAYYEMSVKYQTGGGRGSNQSPVKHDLTVLEKNWSSKASEINISPDVSKFVFKKARSIARAAIRSGRPPFLEDEIRHVER